MPAVGSSRLLTPPSSRARDCSVHSLPEAQGRHPQAITELLLQEPAEGSSPQDVTLAHLCHGGKAGDPQL